MLREISAIGRAAAFSAALALALSACGIKGPLKLPPAKPAAPSAPDAGSAPQPVPDESTPGKKS